MNIQSKIALACIVAVVCIANYTVGYRNGLHATPDYELFNIRLRIAENVAALDEQRINDREQVIFKLREQLRLCQTTNSPR